MKKAKTGKTSRTRLRRKVSARRAGDKSKGEFQGYVSRTAMARLEAIRALISAGGYPNSHTIAREYECSVRTVKRDLKVMQDQLNLPMEFDLKRNGWYFTKPVPFFPSIPLSEKEIVGVFVAQKGIAQFKGTSLEPVLESAFRKMTAGLDDSVRYSLGNLDEVVAIRPLAPGGADLEKFQLLTTGIRERRVAKFLYRKHGEMATKARTVHPCRVAYVNNLWTLFAFDPKAGAMRKFVFFRITALELTDEKFPARPQLDLNEELKGSMGVYKGSEKHEVVIEFDAWGADDVRGRTWHASQVLHEDKATGGLTMTMTLNNLEEVTRWVLSFGKHAEVIQPRELRERVNAEAWKITRKYGR